MKFRQAHEAAALAAVTALTRLAFRSHYLYDIDSVNFALALRRFDPSAHQPHPPGYFLYVCLGRLANLLFADANTALTAISIVFSCAAVVMIYALADRWFGRTSARFAALIFLFSPLAWFHGIVALTYIVEAFFSALVGYLCWRIEGASFRFVLPAAIALGLAGGFRPSSILFLGPLFLFSLRNVPRKQVLTAIAALAATTLAWFIPMLRVAGTRSYMSALLSLWLAVPAKSSVFNSSPVNSIARALVIAGIYCLCFGSAAILPLFAAGTKAPAARQKLVFTRVWIAPGLLFFTFVYLKFVNSGYLLILAPPVCAWLGFQASGWFERARSGHATKILMAAACAAVNTAIFIWAPVYCSYGSVRRFEANLSNIIVTIPQIAPPGQTMIIGLDSHFLGYRHAGYYLPDYLTAQFPEIRLRPGMRVFAMQNGDTSLQSSLDTATAAVRDFVIFPLPANETEYTDYLAHLRSRFPAGDIRLIERGGNEFALGPIRDLPLLFPLAAAPAVSSVHKP